MSVVLSEHLPLLASAPDGIQKLRGLILELAVRGKLVPQDPNDEPASELLKRIAQERARLEAGTTRKKIGLTPPVSEDEQPFALPDGWEWCRFPDVAHYKMGKTPPTKEAAYWSDNGIPWVSISDMNHGQCLSTTTRTVSHAACEKVFRSDPAPAGTLLMSFKLTVGKVATLGIDAFHNEAIISIFPFTGVSQEFLSHFLPMIAQGGNSKSALMGDTLNSESLALLAIPLPPLTEQHRIVAKVDELMALCDRLEAEQTDAEAAHAKLVETLLGTLTQSTNAADLAANWQRLAEHFDTLFTTESSLDALKQTILQLAVMGKLVPQDPNDEPASELLKRIAKERARLEAEGACKKSKPLPPVGEDEKLFEVPNGWEWVPIGAILGVTSSKRIFESDYVTRGVPFYRSKEIGELSRWGTTTANFYISDEKYADLVNSRDFPRAGDLLLTSVGSIGNTWIVDDRHFYFKDGNITQIIQCDVVYMKYVQRFIQGPIFLRMATDTVSGTAYNALTIIKIKQMPFPLPPLAEQHRIVAKVDELMALCDRLKADLIESRSRQERLAATLIESALEAA